MWASRRRPPWRGGRASRSGVPLWPPAGLSLPPDCRPSLREAAAPALAAGGSAATLRRCGCRPLGVVLRGREGGPAAAASLSGLPPASCSLPTAVRRRGRRRPRPSRRGDRTMTTAIAVAVVDDDARGLGRGRQHRWPWPSPTMSRRASSGDFFPTPPLSLRNNGSSLLVAQYHIRRPAIPVAWHDMCRSEILVGRYNIDGRQYRSASTLSAGPRYRSAGTLSADRRYRLAGTLFAGS